MRSRTIFLSLVLLLAAFLRLWQLNETPPSLYHDEAYYGLDALALLRGEIFPIYHEGWELYSQDAHADRPPTPARFPVFFEGNYGREPLHVYLVALSIALFGPEPFAIRLIPALAGTLAVFTTYLAATALLAEKGRGLTRINADKKEKPALSTPSASLLAAFFLAILFPAIHFSRFGIRAMVFLPLATLAVYAFWRGVNIKDYANYTGKKSAKSAKSLIFLWFGLAGLLLGAALYTYAAARLLPLLFVVFVPIWFWLDREAARRYLWPLLLMAGAATLAALPLLLFYWRYPYFLVFRTAYVANRGVGAVEGKPWLTWLNNIWRVALGLFWQGETHVRHNLPGRPYLDPIQFLLFLSGAFAALRQALNPRYAFLIIWLGVMLLPTILSGDAPHFGRMTGAAAPIAILIGLGVSKLVVTLRSLVDSSQSSVASSQSAVSGYWSLVVPRWSFLVPRCSLIVLLSVSLAWTSWDYFGRYANHPQVETDFYLDDWQMGRFAAGQSAETAVYLTPTQEEMATIYYALSGRSERIASYSGNGALPLGFPGQPIAYLVRPEQTNSLAQLTAFFPDGQMGPAQPGYIPFAVPAQARRLPAGARPKDYVWGDQIALRGWLLEETLDSFAITLFWQAQAEMAQNYTAFVHLRDESGAVIAQLDRPPAGYPTSDWRPGEWIRDQFVIPQPVGGLEGAHTFVAGFYEWPSLTPLGEAVELD